jgi:hypothetical protein
MQHYTKPTLHDIVTVGNEPKTDGKGHNGNLPGRDGLQIEVSLSLNRNVYIKNLPPWL